MQTQRWPEVYRLVGQTASELPRGSRRFADRVIVLVLLFAAFNHKPISWAAERRKTTKALGHIRHAPGRLRALEMLEGPSPFGKDLLASRAIIERFFGNADSHSEALGDLPAWVRTHKRVRTWVHAKLIINAVRIDLLRNAAYTQK